MMGWTFLVPSWLLRQENRLHDDWNGGRGLIPYILFSKDGICAVRAVVRMAACAAVLVVYKTPSE